MVRLSPPRSAVDDKPRIFPAESVGHAAPRAAADERVPEKPTKSAVAAAESYRSMMTNNLDGLGGVAVLADTMSAATQAGNLVQFTGDIVRDLICDLVARVIVWAAEALLRPDNTDGGTASAARKLTAAGLPVIHVNPVTRTTTLRRPALPVA